MLRRRLSPLGRASLYVAHTCAENMDHIPLIYASRHGELARTVGLLEALAAGEPLSPTSFSLSVLNATAGIYSTLRRDASSASAVSAGVETLGFGLVEAVVQWQTAPLQSVLFVYADAPLPEIYPADNQSPSKVTALALLLSREATDEIEFGWEVANGDSGPLTQAEALHSCLAHGTGATWSGESRTWYWRRCA